MRRAAIILACFGLTACGGDEHEDLQQWMQESTKDFRKSKLPPLPEIKRFPAVAYEAGDLLDPYNSARIEPERKAGGGGIRPDFDRRKEPLESYPLESLKMVGTLTKGKMAHALIQVDKNLHQVKVGNYLGQNFGIITDISETEVTLRELVPDSLGDYMERVSTLQLQEQGQPGGTK